MFQIQVPQANWRSRTDKGRGHHQPYHPISLGDLEGQLHKKSEVVVPAPHLPVDLAALVDCIEPAALELPEIAAGVQIVLPPVCLKALVLLDIRSLGLALRQGGQCPRIVQEKTVDIGLDLAQGGFDSQYQSPVLGLVP